jgi:hypothetical protein
MSSGLSFERNVTRWSALIPTRCGILARERDVERVEVNALHLRGRAPAR